MSKYAKPTVTKLGSVVEKTEGFIYGMWAEVMSLRS
jgi:hypothetical protein